MTTPAINPDVPDLTPEQQIEFVKRLRVKGEADLPFFAKDICGFGNNPDPSGPKITEDQDELLKWLSAESNWLRIMLTPRDTLKSTCLQAYILWRLVKNPQLRVLMYGEVHEQAKKRLDVIQRVIEHGDIFRACYGDLKGPVWNNNMATLSSRKSTGVREANLETAGLDVTINARHFDIICVDDCHSESNTKTKEQIDDVKRKIELLMPLLTKGGIMIIAGVFWSDNDVHVQLSEDESVDLFKRSIYRDDGTSQYPHQLPLDEIDKRKKYMREDLFACHYLMDPVPKSSQKFQPEWFYRIPRSATKDARVYLLCDPAGDPTSEGAAKRDSDYTAIVAAGVMPTGDIACFDFFRGRVNPTESLEMLLTMYLRHRPFVVGIEKTGLGNLGFHFRDLMRSKGYIVAVEDLMPRGRSKYDRIMALEPLARCRKIFIAEEAQMVPEFIDEAQRFPKAKHDDLCDALSYILDLTKLYGRPQDNSDDDMDTIPLNLRELNQSSQKHWMGVHKGSKKPVRWVEDFV